MTAVSRKKVEVLGNKGRPFGGLSGMVGGYP